MADITKCPGTGCPLRDNCYRFTAKPHPFAQSYTAFTFDPEQGCEYFIHADERERAKWDALRRNEVTPGEQSEPEKAPPDPKLCPYHGSYHPCTWCEKGAPDFNIPHPGLPSGPAPTP